MAFQADKLTRITAWVFDSDQQIAVCGTAPRTLKVYDEDGNISWQVADSDLSGRQVANGPDGDVVLAAVGVSAINQYVKKYDVDGNLLWSQIVVPSTDPDASESFIALQCDPSGNVFYVFGTSTGAARLGKLDADTGAQLWLIEGADVASIQCIRCDADGNLFVSFVTRGLKKLSGSTGSVLWSAEDGTEFSDLAVDNDGNVFARRGTPGSMSIVKYSTGGSERASRAIDGLSRFGIDVDENGEPWFLTGSTVVRFNSALTVQQASFAFSPFNITARISTALGGTAVVVLDDTLGYLALYEPNSSGVYVEQWNTTLSTMQDLAQRWVE